MELSVGQTKIQPLTKQEAIIKLKATINEADHKIMWLPFYESEMIMQAENEACQNILSLLDSAYSLTYSGDIQAANNAIVSVLN